MIGLGLKIQVNQINNVFISLLAKRYILRVENDGGIIEAKECLKANYSLYNWNYYFRVTDDNGTIESLQCTDIPTLVPTYLLKDDNGFLLQENGFKIII